MSTAEAKRKPELWSITHLNLTMQRHNLVLERVHFGLHLLKPLGCVNNSNHPPRQLHLRVVLDCFLLQLPPKAPVLVAFLFELILSTLGPQLQQLLFRKQAMTISR